MSSSNRSREMAAASVRTAFLYDSQDLRIENISPQAVPAKHVAVQPKFCGVCGSDLAIYFDPLWADMLRTAHPLTGISIPIAFGHEFAGVVTELGPDVTSEGLRVGDRVAVMPTLTDGECVSCRAGHTNNCAQLGFLGINSRSGGMSDRVVVPAELVFKLPDGVGCDVGALIEPLAVAWHALSLVDRASLTPDATVLILGGGAVGCAVLVCLRAHGVSDVIVSEPSLKKWPLLRALGAKEVVTPEGVAAAVAEVSGAVGGIDIVFECAGVPGRTIHTAVDSVRCRGTIMNLALQDVATVPLKNMIYKEARFLCSIAYTAADFRDVLHAVSEGRINPRTMITDRIRLEDLVPKGLVALKRGEIGCKVMVDLEM